MSDIHVPNGWEIKTLGEVCEINPSRKEIATLSDNIDVSFVPMAAVSEEGKLLEVKTRKVKEVRKGFPHFRENDILVAKITPCFENGKRWLAKSLVNKVGFGSTEFHVLRRSSRVLPEWIYYAISSPDFRKDGQKRMTGTAGQKRVPASFLENYRIPVPPISIQERVVKNLQSAEGLREIRQEANQLTSKIIQSVFLKMFGDPLANPRNYNIRKIAEVARVIRGASPRPKGDPRYFGGPVPWIKISDITEHGKYLTATEEGVTEAGKKKSVFLRKGTLIISNSATVGLPCFLKVDGCIHDGFLALLEIDSSVDPQFIYYFFDNIRPRLQELAPSGTQRNLNTGIMKQIPIPIPPLKDQKRFAKLVEHFEVIQASQLQSTRQTNELFYSLVHKAFNGALGLGIAQ